MSDSVIKTAGRVFEVLEYMRDVRRLVTVREISEKLQYPLSSAQVLLKSIAQLGYLRYDTRKRAYLATPRLAVLGDWVLESMANNGIKFETLEQIALETGLTAVLGVENDIYVQYTHVALGKQERQLRVQPGTRRLLCMSGLGWVLLSTATQEDLMKIVHRTNNRLEPGGQRISLQEVQEHVQEARSKGYSYSHGTANPDRSIIGIVTSSDDTDMRYAVGVSGDASEIENRKDEIVSLLKARIW